MASNPITMKRDGSGSLAQNLALYLNPPPGPTVYGSAYKGLMTASGDPNPETIAAGIVIFLRVMNGNIEEGIWANDVNGTQEFGAWCEAHGIVGDEYMALSAAVRSASGTYYTACVPVIGRTCVLCTGPGGGLLIRGKSIFCRVGHEWLVERTPPDIPATASVEAVSGEIQAGYAAAGMLDLANQSSGDRVFLEGPEGLVDIPDGVYGEYIPWSGDWQPIIHDVVLLGMNSANQYVEIGTTDAFVVYQKYASIESFGRYPLLLGSVSRVLDYYAFSRDYSSPTHYAPNSPGGEILNAGSYEAAMDFLGSIVTNFPAEAVFPDPVDVGQMWRAGTYYRNGELVAINSSANPFLIGGDSEYWPSWIKIGDCAAGVDHSNPSAVEAFRIDNVAPSFNNGEPIESTGVQWVTEKVSYKVFLSEEGTLNNVSLRVTAFTGFSRSPSNRLPGNSYIIIGIVYYHYSEPRFNTPNADIPCEWDSEEEQQIGTGSSATTVTVRYYRIEAGDLFEKDAEGRLLPGQKKTFSIPSDWDSPYYGMFKCREGYDIAAAWNDYPELHPSAGLPDFDTFVEPDAYTGE